MITRTAPSLRKTPARRAFIGMAGSPLSRIRKLNKLIKQKSDHVLRVPKTPDRESPAPFEVWYDAFGQTHRQIDLDCAFQQCAFDPLLGRGGNPAVDNDKFDTGVGKDDCVSPIQDLGLRPDGTSRRRAAFSTGLLPGERLIKRRRATERSWWVFDQNLLREFIQSKFDPAQPHEAEKAIFVLYLYNYENRQDEEIFEENSWFPSVKHVKQYRQYVTRQGAERFKDQKPESTWHGRRGTRRGFRCPDANCDQCQRNEISKDFSGRISLKLAESEA